MWCHKNGHQQKENIDLLNKTCIKLNLINQQENIDLLNKTCIKLSLINQLNRSDEQPQIHSRN